MTRHDSNAIGIAHEAIVEDALQRIRTAPHLLGKTIESIIHAEPNSELDRDEIDFKIVFTDRTEVLLNVKSCDAQGRKFARKPRRLHKFIAAIVVTMRDTVSSVLQKTLQAIKCALSVARKKAEFHAHLMSARQFRNRRCIRAFAPRMCH